MKKTLLYFTFSSLSYLCFSQSSGTPSTIPDSGGLEPPIGVLYQNPNFPSKGKKVKVDTIPLSPTATTSPSQKKLAADSLRRRRSSKNRKK